MRSASISRRRRALRAVLGLLAILVAVAPMLAQGGLTLQGTRGETLSEGELARGTTIVIVWASWSPRGRDIVDRVRQIQGRWGSRARVVTVNFREDKATIDGFLGGEGLQVPILMDIEGAFAKKHAVTALPGLVVFKDGQVAYRGRLPDDPDQILAELLG